MMHKILLTDDDPLVHLLYGRHIERAGWRMIRATNGRQAIQLAWSEKPQVIVMDVMMPEMDGLAAVNELKRAEPTKSIPVIMISADTQAYLHARELAKIGVASFLPKPFGPSQLLEEIRRLLPAPALVQG